MPVFSIEGRRILFLHVPKTGGTALAAALQAAGEMSFDEPIRRRDGQRFAPRHAPATAVMQAYDAASFDFIFTVVRHPVARALSEYRYQRRKSGLHLAQVLGFDGWLRYSLARSRRDPGYRDNHFRPQGDYLLPGCRVYRYEDGLDAPLAEISALTGRNLMAGLAVKNSSPAVLVTPSQASLVRLKSKYYADFKLFSYDACKADCPAVVQGAGARV
jgi:hypothetical protein